MLICSIAKMAHGQRKVGKPWSRQWQNFH